MAEESSMMDEQRSIWANLYHNAEIATRLSIVENHCRQDLLIDTLSEEIKQFRLKIDSQQNSLKQELQEVMKGYGERFAQINQTLSSDGEARKKFDADVQTLYDAMTKLKDEMTTTSSLDEYKLSVRAALEEAKSAITRLDNLQENTTVGAAESNQKFDELVKMFEAHIKDFEQLRGHVQQQVEAANRKADEAAGKLKEVEKQAADALEDSKAAKDEAAKALHMVEEGKSKLAEAEQRLTAAESDAAKAIEQSKASDDKAADAVQECKVATDKAKAAEDKVVEVVNKMSAAEEKLAKAVQSTTAAEDAAVEARMQSEAANDRAENALRDLEEAKNKSARDLQSFKDDLDQKMKTFMAQQLEATQSLRQSNEELKSRVETQSRQTQAVDEGLTLRDLQIADLQRELARLKDARKELDQHTVDEALQARDLRIADLERHLSRLASAGEGVDQQIVELTGASQDMDQDFSRFIAHQHDIDVNLQQGSNIALPTFVRIAKRRLESETSQDSGRMDEGDDERSRQKAKEMHLKKKQHLSQPGNIGGSPVPNLEDMVIEAQGLNPIDRSGAPRRRPVASSQTMQGPSQQGPSQTEPGTPGMFSPGYDSPATEERGSAFWDQPDQSSPIRARREGPDTTPVAPARSRQGMQMPVRPGGPRALFRVPGARIDPNPLAPGLRNQPSLPDMRTQPPLGRGLRPTPSLSSLRAPLPGFRAPTQPGPGGEQGLRPIPNLPLPQETSTSTQSQTQPGASSPSARRILRPVPSQRSLRNPALGAPDASHEGSAADTGAAGSLRPTRSIKGLKQQASTRSLRSGQIQQTVTAPVALDPQEYAHVSFVWMEIHNLQNPGDPRFRPARTVNEAAPPLEVHQGELVRTLAELNTFFKDHADHAAGEKGMLDFFIESVPQPGEPNHCLRAFLGKQASSKMRLINVLALQNEGYACKACYNRATVCLRRSTGNVLQCMPLHPRLQIPLNPENKDGTPPLPESVLRMTEGGEEFLPYYTMQVRTSQYRRDRTAEVYGPN